MNLNILMVKKWHTDNTDSLKRKRGWTRIFLLLFVFKAPAESNIYSNQNEI